MFYRNPRPVIPSCGGTVPAAAYGMLRAAPRTSVAPAGAATLVFRRIAFKRREVQLPADQNTADATLEPDVFNLEAVVVTGQATGVERRNAAIATSVITGSEVTSVPAPAVDRALQGRGPGACNPHEPGRP